VQDHVDRREDQLSDVMARKGQTLEENDPVSSCGEEKPECRSGGATANNDNVHRSVGALGKS